MFESLVLLGSVCVIAAVVGGGLEFRDVKVPVVSSLSRQLLLAGVGAAIVVVAFIARGDSGREKKAPPMALPQACVLEVQKSGPAARASAGATDLPSIQVHDGPSDLAVGRGSLWVAHTDGRVTQIPLNDPPRRVEPLPGVRVGTRHGQVDIAFGYQHVWLVKREEQPSPRGFLAKIAPSSRSIVNMEMLADPDHVATGGGAVWVIDDLAGLSQFDPLDLKLTRRIKVPGEPHGLWAGGAPCVYVATTAPDGFVVFNANDPTRTPRVYAVGGASEVAAGAGSLWLTGRAAQRAVLRVDPSRPTRPKLTHLPVMTHFDTLAVSQRGVWTGDGAEKIVRLDPAGERPAQVINVAGDPVAIAIGGEPERVWVARRGSDLVTPFRP